MNNDEMYPDLNRDLLKKKAALAPKNIEAWLKFSRTSFEEGALSADTKELIAIAVAHTTQCPYCIRDHTRRALKKGLSKEEIMEAIWIAAEMRSGAAYAHASIAMDEMEKFQK